MHSGEDVLQIIIGFEPEGCDIAAQILQLLEALRGSPTRRVDVEDVITGKSIHRSALSQFAAKRTFVFKWLKATGLVALHAIFSGAADHISPEPRSERECRASKSPGKIRIERLEAEHVDEGRLVSEGAPRVEDTESLLAQNRPHFRANELVYRFAVHFA